MRFVSAVWGCLVFIPLTRSGRSPTLGEQLPFGAFAYQQLQQMLSRASIIVSVMPCMMAWARTWLPMSLSGGVMRLCCKNRLPSRCVNLPKCSVEKHSLMMSWQRQRKRASFALNRSIGAHGCVGVLDSRVRMVFTGVSMLHLMALSSR